MIAVTRLDGETVYINERNIQWVESLPDTAITFLGGARLLVREKPEELMRRIDAAGRAERGSDAGAERATGATGL